MGLRFAIFFVNYYYYLGEGLASFLMATNDSEMVSLLFLYIFCLLCSSQGETCPKKSYSSMYHDF